MPGIPWAASLPVPRPTNASPSSSSLSFFVAALHVQDRMERMLDLDQIGLRRHDGLDVLVGSRGLVEHALSLGTFDPLGGLPVIFHGEALPGLRPAHEPAGAVAAAIEAVRVATSPHDEGGGPHAAWDHPAIACSRPDRSLARDEDILAVVVLALHVVVGAVDFNQRRTNLKIEASQYVDDSLHHEESAGGS